MLSFKCPNGHCKKDATLFSFIPLNVETHLSTTSTGYPLIVLDCHCPKCHTICTMQLTLTEMLEMILANENEIYRIKKEMNPPAKVLDPKLCETCQQAIDFKDSADGCPAQQEYAHHKGMNVVECPGWRAIGDDGKAKLGRPKKD